MRSRPHSWLSTLTQLGFTRQKTKHRQKNRDLRVESLEDRRLLAITVMNTNDMGAGSLRAAIASAMPGETIDFDSMLDGATIDLNSALTISKNLTIDASALDDGIILDAGNGIAAPTGDGHRIFVIDDGDENNHLDVTLNGFTMTGGDVGVETINSQEISAGGAILNGESLTIINSKIHNNAAVDNDFSTGEDAVDAGSRFAHGGAIYSDGPELHISETEIFSNLALADASGQSFNAFGVGLQALGGAIYATSANLTISDSSVSGNIALSNASNVQEDPGIGEFGTNGRARGGGIYTRADTGILDVTRTTIAGNTARHTHNNTVSDSSGTTSAEGGGISIKNSVSTFLRTIKIDESTVSGNQAVVDGNFGRSTLTTVRVRGGGIDASISASQGNSDFEIVSSTISGNRAEINFPGAANGVDVSDVNGGGLFVQSYFMGTGEVRIAHSTIAENEIRILDNASNLLRYGGGGIFNYAAGEDFPLILDHVIAGNNTSVEVADDLKSDILSFSSISNSHIEFIDMELEDGDPDLGPLTNNGGPTLTHAPNCGSPVVEAGDPMALAGVGTVPSFDQRGFGRVFDLPGPSGGPIDIGAVEIGLFDVPVLAADFDNDGDVDGSDFVIWQQNNGITAGATKMDGDANGDGMVNQVDLMIWSQQYGLTSPLTADFNSDMVVDDADWLIWQESNGNNAGGDADGDGDTDEVDLAIWHAESSQTTDCHQWAASFAALDEVAPDQILVSTTRDENDGNYSLGDLSLREALVIANSTAGADTIVFSSAVTGSIDLTGSMLSVSSDVDIVGPGADLLTVDAQGNSRVFGIGSGTTATISGLTITGGDALGGGGGGIASWGGDLTLQSVVVTDNQALGSLGGGVYNANSTAALTVLDSTFSNNRARQGGGVSSPAPQGLEIRGSTFAGNQAINNGGSNANGGAVHLFGATSGAEATIVNSTFSGNTSEYRAGAFQLTGNSSMTIVNSTIAYNDAVTSDGGLRSISSVPVVLHNTILAQNTAPGANPDGSGTLDSGGQNNLVGAHAGSGSLDTVVNGNLIGINPQLDPTLSSNGGATQTHALLSASPAIDAGNISQSLSVLNGLDFVDQRGFNRVFDDSSATGSVDIGAYERGLIVSTADDENDPTFDRDDLSLREAIAALSDYFGNGIPESNVIEFDDSVVTAGTINLSLGGLTLADDAKIAGPGANQLEVRAQFNNRLLQVSTGVDAEIEGITLKGSGKISQGAVIQNQGDLALIGSRVTNGQADLKGGGIWNGDSLTIVDTLIEDNKATLGGGIYNDSTASKLEIVNSTISGNTDGGGIHNDGPTAMLTNVTVAFNSTYDSSDEGGIDGSALLRNTIVTDNTNDSGATQSDISSLAAGSAFNMIGQGTTIADDRNGSTRNIVLGTMESSGLAALADNGGPTQTHSLSSGSLAIDAGDAAFATLFDQRGENRLRDGDGDGTVAIDLGALEVAFGVI